VAEFHPEGFRTMAMALADANLLHALPDINVPTLLLYGDQDVRAPVIVAEVLRGRFQDHGWSSCPVSVT
jgi:pimeloyl-ACP methyl ester carboxylesterase